MKQCVVETCTPIDAITVARWDYITCDRPKRSRQADNVAALAIEIPAWFAIWIRMYSRWVIVRSFAADDYIMMAVGVIYTAFLVIGQIG